MMSSISDKAAVCQQVAIAMTTVFMLTQDRDGTTYVTVSLSSAITCPRFSLICLTRRMHRYKRNNSNTSNLNLLSHLTEMSRRTTLHPQLWPTLHRRQIEVSDKKCDLKSFSISH